MIIEFFVVGLISAALLLALGWFAKKEGSNAGNHFLIGGALILIIIGLFSVVDSQGLEVQTYGGCVNQTIAVYEYENFTEPELGKWGAEVVNITTNYTYGECYKETTGFNLSQMIAVVLLLIGLGTMIGVVGWSKTEDLYSE